tara:strand:+ start:158 stop:475 length:318 start_codon:yes stop_codon:yes gene_type:complete
MPSYNRKNKDSDSKINYSSTSGGNYSYSKKNTRDYKNKINRKDASKWVRDEQMNDLFSKIEILENRMTVLEMKQLEISEANKIRYTSLYKKIEDIENKLNLNDGL